MCSARCTAKFMDSEIELDGDLQELKALAAAPTLYPEFVSLNAVPSILGLLSHDNTDISLSVCDW